MTSPRNAAAPRPEVPPPAAPPPTTPVRAAAPRPPVPWTHPEWARAEWTRAAWARAEWVYRGRRMVRVRAGLPGSLSATGIPRSVPALTLFAATRTGGYTAVARVAGAAGGSGVRPDVTGPPDSARPPDDLDEHFAVDAESGAADRWLDCADVLHGHRPRPERAALRWVENVLTRRTGCRLAALPLPDGGWAVAERTGSRRLPPSASASGRPLTPMECSLVASCLHGLLVAGDAGEALLSLTVLPVS
ncbi:MULTISPECIES: hypothetical protein [Streptomyces]|uniref:hypothetical protein n=1 Tax=Streptomyces TaxID=1883 RepID=UPI001415C8C8|nr:hypothetical protein [Streptomyces sp. SID7805]MYU50587.1 hypothetical protein [Streptomyces sp. SID7805]